MGGGNPLSQSMKLCWCVGSLGMWVKSMSWVCMLMGGGGGHIVVYAGSVHLKCWGE